MKQCPRETGLVKVYANHREHLDAAIAKLRDAQMQLRFARIHNSNAETIKFFERMFCWHLDYLWSVQNANPSQYTR